MPNEEPTTEETELDEAEPTVEEPTPTVEKSKPVKRKAAARDCPFCTGRMSHVSSVDFRGYIESEFKCNKCGFVATFRK